MIAQFTQEKTQFFFFLVFLFFPMSVRTHLMFQNGDAEEAMQLYVSSIPNSSVEKIVRDDGGKIKYATFVLRGSAFSCIDSPIKHDFEFTPSSSIFVECETEDELDAIAAKLDVGGTYMMPKGNYGFSDHFAFLKDRFGVSFQLSVNTTN
jgi:predicted 3-demethylubiquinone-9 3-methyltransferase (glyoxalase superfamily)